MDWRIESIVRRIVEKVSSIIEIDKFSLSIGSMSAVRIRVCFALNRASIPGVWIPILLSHVWVEMKYEQLLKFCYYRGLSTRPSRYV